MTLVFKRILITALVLCFASSVVAQIKPQAVAAEVALPDPLTPETARDLVSTLSDEQVRTLLLEHLDAVAKDKADSVGKENVTLIGFVRATSHGVYETVRTAVIHLPMLWTTQAESFGNFYKNWGAKGLITLLGSLLLAVAAGLVAEFIAGKVTRRWHAAALSIENPETLGQTIRFLLYRLLHEIYGLIAFFIVARMVTRAILPADLLPIFQIIVFNLIVTPRIGAAFARFLLAPQKPKLRLLHTDDTSAQTLYRHLIGMLLLLGFTVAIVEFNILNGVSIGTASIGFWLNISIHIYAIWIIWKTWDGLVMIQRGNEDVTPFEARSARFYPAFGIIISVAMWILFTIVATYGLYDLLLGAPHFKTMALLLSAPIFDTLVRGLVRHLVPPMQGEGATAERAYLSTKRSYIHIGRVLLFALVIFMIAYIWGVNLSYLADSNIGSRVASNLIEVLIILALGYLLMELVSLWINRKMAAEQTALGIDLDDQEIGGGEGGGVGGTRLSTVLPLVLSISKTAIVIITALLALGNIGINITPLLAGAGIIGLAIGFGAQKLVSDIVSGIFFLLDDAFRVGEYVEVEGTVGTVEKISIRSMQLRHHKGPVHTIPYGEIPKITNYSRDWVIVKLKFTVPFETDPNKIKKMFKKIGAEMMQVPEFEQDFLQPFKSQGVFDFDDVGMIIRGKFMAKPGKQWMIRKEIFNRVKAAFEAEGIDFARREVRVNIPGIENANNLSDDDKAAIAAAASEVAQQEEPVEEEK
ncbi:MAG: mechanosensitive ion channel, partial [Proteobacteria bacterium]|nr:mechanosensitive ion channel [Pseudomonadota bacterium]